MLHLVVQRCGFYRQDHTFIQPFEAPLITVLIDAEYRYPNVMVVIRYEMCHSLCSLIQRAGRAARTPGTEALFIYMVESWVKGERIDKQSTAYVKDPDTLVRPVGKGKKDK